MTDRILDKGLEDNLVGAVDKQVHESKKSLIKAGNMLQDKQRGLEESVGQRPYEWVAGAFLVGILLGKLLTKSRGDR